MAIQIQHRRSSTASKRPTAANLLEGEIGVNFNDGTPGLFIEDSTGAVRKIGPVEVSGTAPNSSPASGGATGNSNGELWYDTANSVLKTYNGSAFVVAGSTTIGTTSIDLGSTSTTLAGLTSVSSDLVTFPGSTSGNFSLQSAAASDSTTYTWPAADGTANQVLSTNGSGTLTWAEARTNDITQGDTSVVVTDTGTDGNIAFTTDGTNVWNIDNAGAFLPGADSSYDIGASGNEVANVYADALYGTLQTASQTNITGVGTLTTGTWNADIVAPLYGGTGLDGSSALNGSLLIGNGSGYTLGLLGAGEAITITNASGSITIGAEDAAAGVGSANKGVASYESSDFSVTSGHVTLDGSVPQSVTTDSGSATPATSAFSILGGTGLSTSATGADVTIDIDAQAGLTAATYGADDTVGTFTVNAQGILTAAADVLIDIAHTQVNDFDAGVQTNRLDQMAAPTAAVDFNGQNITGVADPVNAQDAATKAYVDATSQGLDVKPSVRLATAGALSGTYNNGTSGVGATLTNNTTLAALSVDSIACSAGDRILVKNQGTQAENGIYEVTTVGDGSTAWVLTRATDMDEPAEFPAAFVFTEEGAVNDNAGFVCTTNSPVTVGTTAITYEQFSGAGQIDAGTGMTKTGNTLDVVGTANRITANADSIDIASTYVGQTSLTTLGTITTGTWNADVIGLTYGGTGVDNTSISQHFGFLGPNSGGAGNASFREILTSDIAPTTGGSFDGGSF